MKNKSIQSHLLQMQQHLLNFAYSLTANRDDAHDLLQETSCRVLDNEEKFAEDSNFKGWAFTIMRNIFINSYRRAARAPRIAGIAAEIIPFDMTVSSVSESPESAVLSREFNEALDELSDEYRRPFAMHVTGYKYHEIASALGIPLGTVKSRIFYVRKRLQSRFADYR